MLLYKGQRIHILDEYGNGFSGTVKHTAKEPRFIASKDDDGRRWITIQIVPDDTFESDKLVDHATRHVLGVTIIEIGE